jgi:transcriptional regulator with XRE-family HTH domain
VTEIDDNQLRELIDQGLSQREIARRLGIPRSTLQDWMKRQAVAPARASETRKGGGAGAPQVGQMEVFPPERSPGYAIIPLDVVHTIMQRFDRLEDQLGLAAAAVRKPTVAVAVLCSFRQLRASSLYEESSSPQRGMRLPF